MLGKSQGTKDIKIVDPRNQYLQHMIQSISIKIEHLQASGQQSDMLTKTLHRTLFDIQFKILQIGSDM